MCVCVCAIEDTAIIMGSHGLLEELVSDEVAVSKVELYRCRGMPMVNNTII